MTISKLTGQNGHFFVLLKCEYKELACVNVFPQLSLAYPCLRTPANVVKHALVLFGTTNFCDNAFLHS